MFCLLGLDRPKPFLKKLAELQSRDELLNFIQSYGDLEGDLDSESHTLTKETNRSNSKTASATSASSHPKCNSTVVMSKLRAQNVYQTISHQDNVKWQISSEELKAVVLNMMFQNDKEIMNEFMQEEVRVLTIIRPFVGQISSDFSPHEQKFHQPVYKLYLRGLLENLKRGDELTVETSKKTLRCCVFVNCEPNKPWKWAMLSGIPDICVCPALQKQDVQSIMELHEIKQPISTEAEINRHVEQVCFQAKALAHMQGRCPDDESRLKVAAVVQLLLPNAAADISDYIYFPTNSDIKTAADNLRKLIQSRSKMNQTQVELEEANFFQKDKAVRILSLIDGLCINSAPAACDDVKVRASMWHQFFFPGGLSCMLAHLESLLDNATQIFGACCVSDLSNIKISAFCCLEKNQQIHLVSKNFTSPEDFVLCQLFLLLSHEQMLDSDLLNLHRSTAYNELKIDAHSENVNSLATKVSQLKITDKEASPNSEKENTNKKHTTGHKSLATEVSGS